MHVGVKIGPALDRGLGDMARAAEEAGFDSAWLSERVVIPLDREHPYEPSVDPWIGLAYVAAVTERVKLGTSVSQVALRPPVLMARELATLDRLSAGRLIVGVGAGWVEEEFTTTGVPFETRGGRLNEAIRLMRHLWTNPGEPWHGRFFDVPRAGIVAPLTPGGPPIFVGAGSRAGLRRAALYGDGFIGVTARPEQLAHARAFIEDMRASAGRTGPFAYFTQAAPPADAGEAVAIARAYAEVGADGLILTYPGGTPEMLMGQREIVRALAGSGQ